MRGNISLADPDKCPTRSHLRESPGSYHPSSPTPENSFSNSNWPRPVFYSAMPFSSLLRKSRKTSDPSPAHSAAVDVASDPFSGNSNDLSQRQREAEKTPPLPHPWSTKIESPAPNAAVREMPTPMPLPTGPGIIATNINMVPPTEVIPAISPLLAETWDKVKDGPKGGNVGRIPDALADAIATVQDNAAPFTPLITGAATAIGQSKFGEVVKEGIDGFFDGIPVFMKALDEVKSLHPFIGVVVIAFKTVYSLEQKRRDNEKKIIVLYVEMKDMMSVLLLLGKVTPDKLITPEGTIKDRLESLIESTAEDIKKCSTMCQIYAEKKLLAKVFRGPAWNEKLLNWVKVFSNRRKDFEFELSIYTSQGVDNANAKLDAIDEKMNVLKTMFEQLVSPEQKHIEAAVAANGGEDAVKNNDELLLELERTASNALSAQTTEGNRAPQAKPVDTNLNADDLKADIFEDPDTAVEKNTAVYSRRFEAQKRQIIDELDLVVKREGDRVIQELKGGPHERIRDSTIHEIWVEMGWRGNVKTRHLVLALRDHYLEMLGAEAEEVPGMGITSIMSSRNPDAWAIKFFILTRLQPILEAIDDDASGFITISEMNRFTCSRPYDWSLPHWIAFWAVGYRASIIDYANRIEELFAKMEGIRCEVLPPNRRSIDIYFSFWWRSIRTLTVAVTSLPPDFDAIHTNGFEFDIFATYVEAEEARLHTNLKAVDCIIDSTDCLALLTGVGRIEKTVFPLIYLLMKRHYEIMRVMRTKVLDPRELDPRSDSLVTVVEAIRLRMADVTNIFLQQKRDPKKEFQTFAYGIFKYFHNEKDPWSSDYVQTLNSPVIPYDDSNEDQNISLGDILKHEYKDEVALDDWVYDGHSIDDTPNYGDVEPPLKDILGHWHGYSYDYDGTPTLNGTRSMMTFVLEPADGEYEFKANAWSIKGRDTITGSWFKDENGITKIKLMTTPQSFSWCFSGRFDAERDALTGVWGQSLDAENSWGPMEFRRISPRYLTVYPSIKELSDNRSRVLWRFAIAAVLNDIRRVSWSYSYFSQRRKDRQTVISLGIRYFFYVGKGLKDEEDQLLLDTLMRLTPADACFYGSKINRTVAYAQEYWHVGVRCAWCLSRIDGARLFCLDCDCVGFRTRNLCCARECMAARITGDQDFKVAHEPSHRLVKVRSVVLERQLGRVYASALVAFERVQTPRTRIAGFLQGLEDIDKRWDKTSSEMKNPSNLKPTPEITPHEGDNGKPGDDVDFLGGIMDEVKDVGDTSQDPSSEGSQGMTQPRDNDPPSCGKCMDHLSFPCWHCINCEDDLFLCDACDGEGVPELMRSSGKHTEDHPLIRCLAPEKDDDAPSSAEQRLTSLEDRLNSMHSRFDNMQSRLDGLTQGLNSRIGNMEQLLQRIAGAVTAGTSA